MTDDTPVAEAGRGSHKALFREYVEALLIAVILATFTRTFVFQPFQIPTGSMEETLLVGDHILVNKFIYGPTVIAPERWLLPHREVERGDVVVFKYPEDPRRDFIKRCIGVPGDEVELVDKQLFLNGSPVDDDSYTRHRDPRVYPSSRFLSRQRRYRDNFAPRRVGAAEYFCLGDNRDNSRDSRAWGNVPRSHLKGRALLIYWSFEPSPPEPRKMGSGTRQGSRGGGLAQRWEQLKRLISRFHADTRGERTFQLVR